MSQATIYQKLLHERWQNARDHNREYTSGQQSFIPHLLPEVAVQMKVRETLGILGDRYGRDQVSLAITPVHTQESPVAHQTDTRWLQRANTVGVNVRTIGHFFDVVKYALTLPASQSNIHLLPIWEPGVVMSLYGMASWHINPEFFSRELMMFLPHLNTVEKQLKVTINLLHLMGKTVGMDVIPHTDRYSEMVLTYPAYFEWLIRRDKKIVNHRADLHEEAEQAIMEWLRQHGTGRDYLLYPSDAKRFFGADFGEAKRSLVLFGHPHEYGQRHARRASLLDHLFKKGLEPVPATMAPPYRGLEVDPTALTRDAQGRVWRDYRITRPESMSRVFGPLTRFKFYERLDDNRQWEIDFSRPRKAVWTYFCDQYQSVRDRYHFDFMRGDMSHVQMRPQGVPKEPDEFYDPLGAVRNRIRQTQPYFGYFAESFLAPPNTMAYGNEADHLEASDADTTLGDLQSMVVGSADFIRAFAQYVDLLQHRRFAPNFTIITGDKDDPRFDQYYLKGNEARLFIGLFLTDMPSYMSLGFRQRDPHPEPAPNEHYTKLYVFHLDEGPKATQGSYQWGQNAELFQDLARIYHLAEAILPTLTGQTTQWLLPPDPNAAHKVIAWTQKDQPTHLFVVNLDIEHEIQALNIPMPTGFSAHSPTFLFSTKEATSATNLDQHVIQHLQPGEGRCYVLTE